MLGQDTDAQERARALHDQAEADPASVDPEVAAAALGVVAAIGTDADYERCLAELPQRAATRRCNCATCSRWPSSRTSTR